ncbi:MAG: tetratricopeptide repeat protein [Gemmatimonadota bacterium]
MSIESLKAQARRHEQSEEWQKALDQYGKAIAKLDEEDQPDSGLHNRVGDLYVKVGNYEQALEHYDRAIELYRDAYLPNNAIAVCKKIVRHVPARDQVYLVMGQIRAEQGFIPDARENFLKYVELVAEAGDLDESFRALVEFADLVREDVDIRVTVADQMLASDRTEEGVRQLSVAYQVLKQTGRDDRAFGLESRLLELDPDIDFEALADETVEQGATASDGFEYMKPFGDDEDDEAGAPAVAAEGLGDADALVEEESETEELDELPVMDGLEDAWEEAAAEPEDEEEEADEGEEADDADEEDDAPELPLIGFEGPDEEDDEEAATASVDVLDEAGEFSLDPTAIDSEADDWDDEEEAVELPGFDEPAETEAETEAAADDQGEAAEEAAAPEYVDLGSMIFGDEPSEPKTTRFRVQYEEPTGDETADFQKMLSQFKEKVSENLEASDVRAHHDLGTAYKEMGLLDEAISEFQAALRASSEHLPTYELMGQTFLEMGKNEAAVKSLERALKIPTGVEDELLGIYYYLARAHEKLGQNESAVEFYDRVFALDINFADVTERLRALR